MATLVFTAVGTLIGGPIGGAIGALAGRQVDRVIFGSGRQEGPRLKELSVTASSYGTPLPRHFGRMRVPGSIIWATDLVEHRETTGGGKNRPKVTTYTYTASFAVALSSRPIVGVGRIWADGNLLRGEAGDLKAGGAFRLYTGDGDQSADDLIAAKEGAGRCPAYRGLAYAVFEDLELGDFFNRIPALTFEVIADEGAFTVQSILDGVIDQADADIALTGIDGFSCEASLSETLTQLDPFFPMDCDASGESLTLARERLQAVSLPLPEAALSVDDGDFGARSGQARKREPLSETPHEVLRYYDVGRDYQPGVQRALGQPRPGQPRTVELPAALTAGNARLFAERMARRHGWARETLAWRTAELDLAVGPGAVVTAPGHPGKWRVIDWEWRDKGVELSLLRVFPAADAAEFAADSGAVTPPVDIPAPPTTLAAFELPWDGSGSGNTPSLFAAVSSTGPAWAGAALFVDHGDGALVSLGASGRTRSTVGLSVGTLPSANPLIFDRSSSVEIELLAGDMDLADATMRQLSMGANRALLGAEIVQFGRAVPLGNRRWRLEALLRGRGGTEAAVSGHAPGERFVLLDAAPVALDAAAVAPSQATSIAALGRGDASAVLSPIAMRGATLRPLTPVHARHRSLPDGSLELRWTRRARGAWQWPDGVDAPLAEESESYLVSYGPLASPHAVWQVGEPSLTLAAASLSDLAAQAPGEAFRVRQQGSFALSEALDLTSIA